MAAVTITTDTVELFSHEMYFVLTLDDASTASYSARLMDIGKLKYTFDVPNDGEDTTAVGVKAGAMNIVIEDFFIGSSDTLIDTLVSSYDFSPQTWKAKMYFRTKGGSFGNPVFFTFTQKEVEYKKTEAKVSISLLPKDSVGLKRDEFGDLIESEVSVYDISQAAQAAILSGILAFDYIQHWLYQTFIENPTYPMTSTPIMSSSVFTTTGNPVSGDEWFVWYKATVGGTPTVLPGIKEAGYYIGLLASLEGAIYGGSLGVPFYVSRSDTANTVTLDTDNIVKLDQDYFYDSKYRNLTITHVWTDDSSVEHEIIETTESNNDFAEKDMNIRLPQSGFTLATIDTATTADEIDPTNEIILAGIANYPLAFSFDANKKASVTYWGIDGIYPYSVINFDVDAPAVFQGRDFRIKEIEYDFKQDKSKMEIYEI